MNQNLPSFFWKAKRPGWPRARLTKDLHENSDTNGFEWNKMYNSTLKIEWLFYNIESVDYNFSYLQHQLKYNLTNY